MSSTSSKINSDLEIKQLKNQVKEIKSKLEKYEKLAQLFQNLEVWDYTIYNETPGSDWIAVDRVMCDRIYQALFQLDHKKPWKENIEMRLEGLSR